MFMALVRIDKTKKCFMCKHKFPNGILNKFPREHRPLKDFLKGDFLYHVKETHGIDPEILLSMFIK